MSETLDTLSARFPQVAAARAEGKHTFVPVDGMAPFPSDEDVEACGGAKAVRPVRFADGRLLACDYRVPNRTLVYVQPDGSRTEWPLHAGVEPKYLHVAPSGTRALIVASVGGTMMTFEIDLSDGTLTDVDGGLHEGRAFLDPTHVWEADYIGDDDHIVAVVTRTKSNQLALLERTPDGWRETDNIATDGGMLATQGDVVVTVRKKDAMSFQRVGDQLKKGAKVERVFPFVFPADTREVLWGHRGVGKDPHVFVGEASGKPRKLPRNTVLAPRIAHGSVPAMAQGAQLDAIFGTQWRTERWRACCRSTAGRVVLDARPTWRVAVPFDGTSYELAAGLTMSATHPTEEKALGIQDEKLVIVDLTNGSVSEPLAEPAFRAAWIPLPGGGLAIALQRTYQGRELELHRDTDGPLGEPVSRLAHGAVCTFAGADIIIGRDGKKPHTHAYERWTVSDDLEASFDAHLALPGSRYEDCLCFGVTTPDGAWLQHTGNEGFAFQVR